jgi:hypothetical protein
MHKIRCESRDSGTTQPLGLRWGFETTSNQPFNHTLLMSRRLIGVIELFQKFPEPGRILPDDVDKENSTDRKKKNGQIQQKNDNANQDALFFTHHCLHTANRLPT